MTAYHGGKQRIGKELAEIIVEESISISDEEDFEIKGYCEPFCGMLGVYQHIPELFREEKFHLKYKAGDTNASLIKMWQCAQKGWSPPTKTNESEFMKLKFGRASAKKGFLGHHCSFGGKFFNTFRKERCTTSKMKYAADNVKRISELVTNINFNSGPYSQFSRLKGYVIYCDPPYQVYSDYYDENHRCLKFDHDAFWEWCRRMSQENLVFVSEYKAPRDFTCLAKIKSHVAYGDSCQKTSTEKLYHMIKARQQSGNSLAQLQEDKKNTASQV